MARVLRMTAGELMTSSRSGNTSCNALRHGGQQTDPSASTRRFHMTGIEPGTLAASDREIRAPVRGFDVTLARQLHHLRPEGIDDGIEIIRVLDGARNIPTLFGVPDDLR